MESVEKEQRDHRSMRDAYDLLFQKQSVLSSQTSLQAQHSPGLEVNIHTVCAHTDMLYHRKEKPHKIYTTKSIIDSRLMN